MPGPLPLLKVQKALLFDGDKEIDVVTSQVEPLIPTVPEIFLLGFPLCPFDQSEFCHGREAGCALPLNW